MKIKVLSLNIACFIPWEDKNQLLVELVQEERPDVLCLQEVARNILLDTEEYNQIQKIAKLLATNQYHGNLCNPYIIRGGVRKDESCYHGCATFILNREVKLISNSDIAVNNSNDRFVIESNLQYQGKKITVINLHLEAKARKEEVGQLLKCLKKKDAQRIILCGDINSFEATKGTDVDNQLRENLTDVWRKLKGGLAVTSFGSDWWYDNLPEHKHTLKIRSRSSSYPDASLDFFFCRNLKPTNIRLLPNTVPYLSDHLGLVTEFSIKS